MTIDLILDVILSLVAVFTAIVFHEVAHGWVASRLGDPTAKAHGRLTLNPLAHVDPVGTILVPVTLALLNLLFPGANTPLFGWAKPVPVNPNYFANRFRGMLWVALAGPGTNLALAAIGAGVGRLALRGVSAQVVLQPAGFGDYAIRALFALLGLFVIYSVILAVFNMIPIPPLDGSRVLAYFLPPEGRRALFAAERYGFLILLVLIGFGGVSFLFNAIQPLWVRLLGPAWLVMIFG
ncbi:MAG: site-2 protease family protein [Candidatus Bipolaricaulota bacterium]